MRPVQRFYRLMLGFRTEIAYLYFYAMLAGIVSLSLPLGMQAIIQFVMAGQMSTSLILLTVMVVGGIAITGYLQVMQLWVAEYIQQQIFAKGAFEFSFRIPRIKLELMQERYPPEVMNRFFDIQQIQKGTAKVLLDFSIASLQMFFGLVLLSVYHPLFIALSAILILSVYLLFMATGRRGLETSLSESKHKYQTAFWLQEVARAITTFKVSNESDFVNKKLDQEVSSYLNCRKAHFKVLVSQFSAMIVVKVLIAASLLSLGIYLVINQEINLGQFVAAEIIILLVLNSVEKIVMNMDMIYDLLTSIQKVGEVTDLALEEEGSLSLSKSTDDDGISVDIKELEFSYPGYKLPVISDLSFAIKPGEKIAITGRVGGGKTTFIKLLAGYYANYSGVIKFNDIRLQQIDRRTLHRWVGEFLSTETIFHGTILENIVLGRDISQQEIKLVIDKLGLDNYIDALPNALETILLPEGKRVSPQLKTRILLARAIIQSPGLLLVEDTGVPDSMKDIFNEIILNGPWTLMVVSDDSSLLKSCDRIININQNMSL